MYYDIFGRLTTVDCEITARCIALLNRADPEVLTYMQYNIDYCDATKGENYKLAKEFGQQLINNTCEVIGHPPVGDGRSYEEESFVRGNWDSEGQKEGKVVWQWRLT
jgi:hypothetical protein